MKKPETKHTPFYVIWQDFNRREFEPFDIMPYFINEWKHEKEKPNLNDLEEWFINKSHYMYWSRCQYEVVLAGWPNTEDNKKIDIHWQIKMNLPIILDIFKKNVNL